MNEHNLPSVEIVDMREELHEGNRSMFSRCYLKKSKIVWKRRNKSYYF